MNFLPAHLQQTVLQLALVLGVSLGWGGGYCPHGSWGHWRLLILGTARAVGNDSCLLPRTLICYCSRAAVQHAAESRWQPGRSGGRWGGGGTEGVDTSAWHMWLAAGVGAEELGGWMTGGCDCAGGMCRNSQPSQPRSKIWCFSRWSSNTFMVVSVSASGSWLFPGRWLKLHFVRVNCAC